MQRSIKDEILVRLNALSHDQQRRVLEFARALPTPPPTRVGGTPGQTLLRLAGTIEPDDLRMMAQAIADSCEGIDADEW